MSRRSSEATDSRESPRIAVPANRISFPPEDIDWIVERIGAVLASGRLTLGPFGEALEKGFARLCGRRYAVAVSSGTCALEIVLRSLGVRGRDVLVPANTFFATAGAVLHAGGRPVLVDLDVESLGIRTRDVERCRTAKTAGIVAVHLGGIVSPRMLELADWARREGLWLVEDAAHAHGSSHDGIPAGGFGVAAAFSLYATKVITAGEGGIIVTDDERLAEEARICRDQGKRGFTENLHVRLGRNARLSELNAVVGVRQLERLPEILETRRAIASRYDDALGSVPGLRPLRVPPGGVSNYYKYVALLEPPLERSDLKRRLRERHGVSLAGEVYETPLHRQPALQDVVGGRFPVAETFCRQHVCLPVFPGMGDADVERVAGALSEELEREGSG